MAGVPLVAAENFYGDIAGQIGGAQVGVISILSNPDQDPHLFEVTPSVARAVSAARIVIYNGAGYDPWITPLLAAAPSRQRVTIEVASLIGVTPGENPHLWYDPSAAPALAKRIADELQRIDPSHVEQFQRNLARFLSSLQPIREKIAQLRKRLNGTPVTATEPVFGDMLEALGFQVRNMGFQIAVMNNTEPAPSDIAGFENDLRSHAVKLVVYNRQASDPITERMVRLAREVHVPVVPVTETEPAGETWQSWMMSELDAIDRALPATR
jgi:zinc/manganese transport system substrate-binding protein